MKVLSKDQTKEKAELIDDIRTAHAKLHAAIEEYNSTVATAQDEVQDKLADLNSKIQDAKEWADNVASDMQSYYDEKSENWQDGEKGQNYSSWQTEYENLSADDVEDIDFPEDLEVPECTVADDLENLPDEPS